MTNSVEENVLRILSVLAKQPRDEMGSEELTGDQLVAETGLIPAEVNDVVTILVESGLAEWRRYLGTAPYEFGKVYITPRGRYEYERMIRPVKPEDVTQAELTRPPVPVGSPYGFNDEDWEIVAERKNRSDVLHVAFGYQFSSNHYNSDELKSNIEAMFVKAVNTYNNQPNALKATLEFHPLAAGYGEHIFNEIARDIISADIAVFDTSDFTPNVMLEMGVALTWGVRVLPIKAEGCPKPPSDISGQTWADYRDSGRIFIDPDHDRKLFRMVERAVRKKGRS